METSRTTTRVLIVLLAAALLGACASPAPVPGVSVESDAPDDFPSARFRGQPTDSVFRIDASTLTLRVYRAGRLKQFGHDHTITSSGLRGLIHVPGQDDDISRAFADLYLPVASLVVDDPEDRARAGQEFAAPISEVNREGTRNNLLGPLVLDAQNHPYIHISVTPGSESRAELDVTFKGQHYELAAPVSWHRTNGRLSAAAAFTLTHTSIGLTPFSILGGAIAVAEEIEVSLRVTAVVTPSSQPGS